MHLLLRRLQLPEPGGVRVAVAPRQRLPEEDIPNQNGRAIHALLSEVLRANPEAATVADKEGRLPLHLAALNTNEDEGAMRALLSELLQANPEAATVADKEGRLPLHLAALNTNEDEGAIRTLLSELLQANPEAATVADKEGRLPLHLAALNTNSNGGIMRALLSELLQANPEAATVADQEGHRPLHLAALNTNLNGGTMHAVLSELLQASLEANKKGLTFISEIRDAADCPAESGAVSGAASPVERNETFAAKAGADIMPNLMAPPSGLDQDAHKCLRDAGVIGFSSSARGPLRRVTESDLGVPDFLCVDEYEPLGLAHYLLTGALCCFEAVTGVTVASGIGMNGRHYQVLLYDDTIAPDLPSVFRDFLPDSFKDVEDEVVYMPLLHCQLEEQDWLEYEPL